MFNQRAVSYAAPGKGPELRAALEDRVKSVKSSGRSVAFGQQMFGGPGGAGFVINIVYDNLAAVEAGRRHDQSDPAFVAYAAKLGALIARPVDVQLFEIVIPNPANPVLKAPFFTQRALNYPAQGKGPEVRALLEERVKSLHSGGQRANLSMGVYGSENPVFALTRAFQDLGALDAARSRNQSDSAFQAAQAKLGSLVRQPAQVQLGEVLIPV